MQPTLRDGQLVVCIRKQPKDGQVVCAKVPGKEVVKRAQKYKDKFALSGDSSDSSSYVVKETAIMGVLIWPRGLGS